MQSRSFFCYRNSVYLYTTTRRFLFAHICRNSLFIICSLQNSSYCLLSTISGIFTINALLQQPCVPFHFDKQASFATSTPTNFGLQNHKGVIILTRITFTYFCYYDEALFITIINFAYVFFYYERVIFRKIITFAYILLLCRSHIDHDNCFHLHLLFRRSNFAPKNYLHLSF